VSIDYFLESLTSRGIEIWLEGQQLRYRAPKSALSPELLGRLKDQKVAIIEHLQAKANSPEPFPLTAGQRALWFLHEADPDSPAYNIRFAVRLAGPVDSALLDRAIRLLVRRHPVLRTCYGLRDGDPVQWILPEQDWGLLERSLEGCGPAEAEEHLAAEADRPFDLQAGPVCRVTLFHGLPDGDPVLQISAHHIAFDFAAVEILVTELRTCYAALRSGSTPALPRLPITFREYVEGESRRLAGEPGERSWRHWQQAMAGRLPTLALPTDRPRPDRQTWRGATHHVSLDEGLVAALRAFARREGTTLYTVCLSAYQVLLFRLTHQEDLLIGTPFRGRNRPELEGILGYFSNLIVLRGQLSSTLGFRSLLAQTRQHVLDSMAHGDYPFALLLERLKVERDPSRSPLVQTTFVWDQRSDDLAPGYEGDPLYTDRFTSEQRGANYDLSLTVYDVAGPMRLALAYNSDLFDAATMVRMGRQFDSLLRDVVSRPDVPLDELSLEPAPRLGPPAPSTPPESWRLSFHQERIWFIDLFETGKVYRDHPAYHNIRALVQLSKQPDFERLGRALAVLIDRHGLLQVRVGQQGDEFLLERRLPAGPPLRRGAVDPDEADLERERLEPFDLAEGPPIRATLFPYRDGSAGLAMTIHHLVADADTVRLLLDEWLTVYHALSLGEAPHLAPAPQYGDYARSQREMDPAALEVLRRYWFHRLRGRLQPMVLPCDRPRAAIHVFSAGRLACLIDPTSLTHFLPRGVSPEVALLVAWTALLRRYTGHKEIVLGAADPGRSGFETMVGPLSNLVVLRAQVDSTTSGGDLIRQMEATLEGARAHRDMPFDRLVTELNPEMDMSRTALFDVLFSYHEGLDFTRTLGDLAARYRAEALGYGKYDLHLQINRDRDGFRAELIFNRELFDESTAQGLARHWARLVDALARDPDRPIDEIELLDDPERQLQLEVWNPTRVDWPRGATLPQAFRDCAAHFPDRTALTFGTLRMSYRELDERANHLAARLLAAGVKSQELVALCLDRDQLMPVAILGVLKAGAAYLPLEPSTPSARMEFILRDAGCRLVVTRGDREDALFEDLTMLVLDADPSHRSAEPPGREIHSEDLAYCIYTSGSTGQPKGVLLEHRQVIRLFFNQAPLFDFDEHDVWTLFHSYSFDFSVWEIFGALLFGGRLVIVPGATTTDPAALLALLDSERVTILNQTPSAFVPMAEEAVRHPRPLSLRRLIFGGQQLDPAKLREWHDCYPQVRLCNMYGITETCVHVTYREIDAADMARPVSPIGRPIPTAQTYVVDAHLRLVPRGAPGELLVGGDGLARGYLNRDELTRERFVASPFEPGRRVYRSGDHVRQLADGQLIYLGRLDDQLQLRGFRVELGEIRHALLKQGLLSDAHVAPYGDEQAPGLVAYVVPRVDARESERRLARFEREAPDRDWSRVELPNGVLIVHKNPTEIEFTYSEIFEEQSYLRHGVDLPDGAVVVDVGANIGLFSLFAGMTCRNARILAFEPIPETHEMLRINAALYDLDITAFNLGLGSRPQTVAFTHYPHVSIFSGRFADAEREREVIRAYIRNSGDRRAGAPPSAEEVEAVLRERFQGVQVACRLCTLSQVIREQGLDRIDLLKLDAEKSELDILEGIEADDWPKIRQVVMEAHDIDGRLQRIAALLRENGFQVAVEQESVLENTHLYNVFAVRQSGRPPDPSRFVTRSNPLRGSSIALIRELRTRLRRELPEYMLPSSLVLMDALPLNANGKVDTARLPAPDRATLTEAEFVPPRGPLEVRIAEIWCEVLGAQRVGIHDDFFELGGHSLLVTRLASRLRTELGVEVPVHALFESPTVAGIAELVRQSQLAAQPSDELEAMLSQLEDLPEEEMARRIAEANGEVTCERT
jgi:amino acid adenylation domain-containing protein/FkbM family methyltransferase